MGDKVVNATLLVPQRSHRRAHVGQAKRMADMGLVIGLGRDEA
ncbi:hypothetical protein ACFQ4O_02125 [Methylopila musalis]|uniref:Uncharacterized protein n=1 Tax=Methylopila musalis TaxID=1134781 RepID=A0ABW3Z3L2_9HYPH